MLHCPSCNAQLKRGQSHCSQCGQQVPTQSKRNWRRFLLLPLLFFIIGGGIWLYTEWQEPIKEATPEQDEKQSFTASTTEEEAENPAEVDDETLPETDVVTGTFYESVDGEDIDQFMYNFIDAFTRATYSQDTTDVESFLASGSEFETQTLTYLENTLFEKGIQEDQLDTRVVAMTVDGTDRATLEDGETARVTTNETYRIIREDGSFIASFETTYAVIYQDGSLKIVKNLASEEISREEETY